MCQLRHFRLIPFPAIEPLEPLEPIEPLSAEQYSSVGFVDGYENEVWSNSSGSVDERFILDDADSNPSVTAVDQQPLRSSSPDAPQPQISISSYPR